MGISGLLPALKSIQITRHLSEYRGQTIGVDAYVWLHKGVYSCAPELALGKQTQKYVNYAMERVRLLRHHKIEPYIVFDGGPLPAKRGTESDRKQKREENLARGKLLTSQGKHSQAREYYVKCVDVTPQMAYQLIKALKAENVAYVVAPYEADAQLAYVERTGLVDAILTEDSDLLVFGCRNVLFKLDAVANTIVAISRDNFSSVTASSGDSTAISLVGWSDPQFRAMAILSGCDYLPSIPGVGLKTACSMLRKWRTVDQVIRVLNLEGKKAVPPGYAEKFKLAEKCFLHQRVYDPSTGKLVHLVDIDGPWTKEDDEYVGSQLDDAIARGIAVGDIDPTSLRPMKDINPNFQPRTLRPLPNQQNQRIADKGKEKTQRQSQSGGLFDFFGPNPVIPSASRGGFSVAPAKSHAVVGKASGKRTLTEVMNHDIAVKRQFTGKTAPKLTHSKFFTLTEASCGRSSLGVAGSPCDLGPSSRHQGNKENAEIIIVDDSDEEDVVTFLEDMEEISTVAQADEIIDLEDPLDAPTVEQEDGYLSPTFSDDEDAQDLSSPTRDGRTSKRRRPDTSVRGIRDSEELEFSIDDIPSPPSTAKLHVAVPFVPRPSTLRSRSLSPCRAKAQCAVSESVQLHSLCRHESFQRSILDPNLKDRFGDESEVEEEASNTQPNSNPQTPTSLTPPVPATQVDGEELSVTDNELDDPEELEGQALTRRIEAVAGGWRDRWALNNVRPQMLKRRETNITPAGRHTARCPPERCHAAQSAPPKLNSKALLGNTILQSRRSLNFLETGQTARNPR